MKKFFTGITLQVKNPLDSYVYTAFGNEKLQMDSKTSYPIITAINGYARPDEDFRVISVMPDEQIYYRNRGFLQDELDKLCKNKGLVCTHGVEAIVVPTDQKVSTHVSTFQKLLDFVDDGDELFACMTYGTKPLSTAIMMAVQYAYRVKQNASISCIVYGAVNRPSQDPSTWTGEVYDMTALIQLDEIVHKLADCGITNPQETINRILSL